MAKAHDDTSLGGRNAAFDATRWSLIRDVQGASPLRRKGALNELAGLYWKPVYCFLRRKGYENEAAKDLTQDFFAEKLAPLAEQAQAARGRFHDFLLRSLTNFVAGHWRRARAACRAPAVPPVSLAALDVPPVLDAASPDEALDYAYVCSLLDRVLHELEAEHNLKGDAMAWGLFTARVLTPILENRKPPSLNGLCAKLGLDPAKGSNLLLTVKRRFRAALRRQIGRVLHSEEEVDEEIASLMGALPRSGAGV